MARRRGLAGCRQGAAAVEFAAILPLFVFLLIPLFEVPRALTQTNALEKGLRGGAVYLARVETNPRYKLIESTIEQNAKNIVLRGSIDGDAPYLASGWEDASVVVAISYKLIEDRIIPVIGITATVRFVPVLEILGVFEYDITRSHEQAWIGK